MKATTKERRPKIDMSFNIGGDDRPRKRTRDVDSPTRKKKKSKDVVNRKVELESDLDDARFIDDRPRPPKPKKGKKRSAESAEHLRPLKKAKRAAHAEAPGTALALAGGPGRISRLKDQSLNSILGQDAEAIQQLLEQGDSDSALTQLNKRLLQACVDLIADVETGIRESKGRYGVHSFNGLVTSIRELMIDLQATQDRGAIGVALTKDLIQPSFRDIGLEVMKEYSLILDDAKTLAENIQSDPQAKQAALAEFRQRQVESRTRIGQFLQNSFFTVRDSLVSALQR